MEKYEIEKLRDLSIEEVANQLGLQVNGHHKAICPFHSDHHASLSFNKTKNFCRCFVCMDKSLGTIDLVMRYMHVDFLVACHWLADRFGISIEGRKPAWTCSKKPMRQACEAKSSAPQFNASRYTRFFEHPWLSNEAKRFLFEERKIDPRVAKWCRLSSWQDREGVHWLQTPYFDLQGRLVGVQNRNLDFHRSTKKDEKPRFRFPTGAKCSIYNLPIIGRMKPGDDLYITEGCSDCWAMLSAGHKAIAIPSATLLSDEDKQLLTHLSRSLSIKWHMYPDRDAPGESLFLQLKEILPDIEHHQLPPRCKDFGEAYAKGIKL